MLVEEYRSYLFAIAYRILGSVMEAEDMLQEVYLRTRNTNSEMIRNPKAYLSTIITRLCLNHLSKAQSQRETYVGPWLPEPLLVTDASSLPEAVAVEQDTISIAFMVMLEKLNPAERAIFLLREVFGYDYREIASMVDRSEDACRQTFNRAKKRLDAEKPRFRVTVEQHDRLLHHFIDAINDGDMNALVSLLLDDVVMVSDGGGKATAALYPLHGVAVVAPFLIGSKRNLPASAVMRVQFVNGEPGIVFYDREGKPYTVIQVAFNTNGQIQQVFAVSNPDKLHMLTSNLQ